MQRIQPRRSFGTTGPEGTAEAAKAILFTLRNGPMPSGKVVAEVMDALSCSRATVFRARKRLTNVLTTGVNWEIDPFAEEPEAWWTK